MHEDFDHCYRAVQSKDARFDGWFVTAVLTTRIYCRPSCPVRPPFARNVRFYPTAAAAQRAGFRACKRCRPDASPGSPEWNVRGDVVARAMRLIADGTVDREGVGGLAAQLGYTTRQLERLLQAEVGAGPLALARAQRAQTARVLIETTQLPFGDVAFAAGFSSIRQFNDTVRLVFESTPTDAAQARGGPVRVRRGHARNGVASAAGPDTVRLRGRLRPSGRRRRTRLRGGPRRRVPTQPAASLWQRRGHPDTGGRSRPLRPQRSRTSATSPPRSLAADGCWTSMPTPKRWSRRSVAIPTWARWSPRRPDSAFRARSTRPNWPSARCWANRCRRRPRAPTPPGWSWPTGNRSMIPTAALTHTFPSVEQLWHDDRSRPSGRPQGTTTHAQGPDRRPRRRKHRARRRVRLEQRAPAVAGAAGRRARGPRR